MEICRRPVEFAILVFCEDVAGQAALSVELHNRLYFSQLHPGSTGQSIGAYGGNFSNGRWPAKTSSKDLNDSERGQD